MSDMMDNSFQSRYNRLPIATYAISDLPRESKTMFCHKHYHREFEVIAVTQGQCEFTIDNICRVASSGDIFLIPPYSIHSGSALPGGEFSYFCFSFDLSLLGEPEFAEQFENGYLDITQDITSDEDICRELFPVIVSIFRQSENPTGSLLCRGSCCICSVCSFKQGTFGTPTVEKHTATLGWMFWKFSTIPTVRTFPPQMLRHSCPTAKAISAENSGRPFP